MLEHRPRFKKVVWTVVAGLKSHCKAGSSNNFGLIGNFVIVISVPSRSARGEVDRGSRAASRGPHVSQTKWFRRTARRTTLVPPLPGPPTPRRETPALRFTTARRAHSSQRSHRVHVPASSVRSRACYNFSHSQVDPLFPDKLGPAVGRTRCRCVFYIGAVFSLCQVRGWCRGSACKWIVVRGDRAAECLLNDKTFVFVWLLF